MKHELGDAQLDRKVLIINAAELITCRGTFPKKGPAMSDIGLIPNGALVIEDGIIRDVGETADILARIEKNEYQVVDAAGKCVMPGFVDSHTHFVFGGYRQEEFLWRLEGTPYLEILERGGGILSTVRSTRQSSLQELKELGMRRLDAMLAMGVTTVEGKSGYGLDLETELRQLKTMADLGREHPVEIVPTFMGAHAVPTEYKGRTDEYVSYLADTVLPVVVKQGLAEFCDIFCEKGVFSVDQSRYILKKAQQMGLKAKIHADEIVQLGGAELAGEIGAYSADHLLQASDEGIKALAEKKTIATLLPMTAFCLKEHYARARKMIDSGVAVALASDYNPGSCFSHSIPLVISLAAIKLDMKPAEIVTALTVNAAAAVGRANKVGSLEIGKQADLIILKYPSHLFLVYHVGMNIVEKVIKKGKLVCNNQ